MTSTPSWKRSREFSANKELSDRLSARWSKAVKVRVLLVNDDGVEAKGLAAARDALMAAGISVVTAAPDRPRSGTARSATFRRAVAIKRHGGSDANPIFATNGTPTDTVRVAILSAAAGPIDAVVSGINEGANLGDDASYSSTLGAAIEGALLGYPAIAASQQTVDQRFRLIDLTGYDFRVGSTVLARLVQMMSRDAALIPARSVLNLNAPGRPATGITLAHFDERNWHNGSVYEVCGDGEAGWMVFGTHPEQDPEFMHHEGSDSWCISKGYASLTPMSFKWNDAHSLARLMRWARSVVVEINRDLFDCAAGGLGQVSRERK